MVATQIIELLRACTAEQYAFMQEYMKAPHQIAQIITLLGQCTPEEHSAVEEYMIAHPDHEPAGIQVRALAVRCAVCWLDRSAALAVRRLRSTQTWATWHWPSLMTATALSP